MSKFNFFACLPSEGLCAPLPALSKTTTSDSTPPSTPSRSLRSTPESFVSPGAILDLIGAESPASFRGAHSAFYVGEQVTSLHTSENLWYNATVTALQPLTVEYMDGEIDVHLGLDSGGLVNVFSGFLTMDQVTILINNRNMNVSLESETGVCFPSSLVYNNVELALAGLTGKKNKACVGLYVDAASFNKTLRKFKGSNARSLSQDADFLNHLKSKDITKIIIAEVLTKTTINEVLQILKSDTNSSFASGLRSVSPKNLYKDSSVAVCYNASGGGKGGGASTNDVVYNILSSVLDKENGPKSMNFDVESEEGDVVGDFLKVLERLGGACGGSEEEVGGRREKLCSMMSEMLR